MPPKRDPRDRGKGKGKEKKVVEVEPFNPCDELKPGALVSGRKKPVELDDDIKGMFLLQIDNCEEKLTLLQRKADELDIKRLSYPDLFDQLDCDKRDLQSYLERCLRGKEEELAALKAKYETSETLKQEEEDDQRQQLEDARNEIEEMKQQLNNENAALRVQLAGLKSVAEEKEEICDRIAALTKEFYEREEINKEQIYQQERANTMEVERLRREANVRIITVAEECTTAAKKKLRAMVKQCTADSVRVTATIASNFSDETISRLLNTNDGLRRRTDENQRLIEILEANRVVLDHENQRQCEATEVLVRRLKDYESLDLDFRFQQSNSDIQRQVELMKPIVGDERKLLINATERRQMLQKNLDEVSAKDKSTAATNRDLYDTLTAATPGLQQILPTSDAHLLRRLEMLASEDAVKDMERSEEPASPRRRRVRLATRKSTRKNCVAKLK